MCFDQLEIIFFYFQREFLFNDVAPAFGRKVTLAFTCMKILKNIIFLIKLTDVRLTNGQN